MFYNIYSSIDLIVIGTDRKSKDRECACLLRNVRLALCLRNVTTVHGKNVAAGWRAGWLAAVHR
jgi:hypothetical protein